MAVQITGATQSRTSEKVIGLDEGQEKAKKQASYSATKFDEVYKLEDVLYKCPGRSSLLAE